MSTLATEFPVSTGVSDHFDCNCTDEIDDAMLMLRHYDRLHHRVRRRFPRVLRSAGIEVDDIVQDTFVRAWIALPGFEHRSEGGCYRWLCRIARQHTINLLQRVSARKRGGHLNLHRDQSAPSDSAGRCTGVIEFIVGAVKSPRSIVANREIISKVRQLLALLKPAQRQAIVMRYFEGLPLHTVGAAMGRSESAAAMLCFRGLRSMRSMLLDRDLN